MLRPKDKRKRLPVALAIILLAALPAFADSPVNGTQQAVPTGTPVELGSHDQSRISICWLNEDTTNPIYCGASAAVTSSTGFPFPKGTGFCVDACQGTACGAQSAVYCVSTGGTVTTGVWETR